jgi:catechol 2,3-dioxygenase-like lactoylglutathione lyase family enzyme
MKLGHIELFVNDPSKSKDFYTRVLGFGLTDVQADKFVWIETGSISILLRPGKSRDTKGNYGDATSGMVLYVENLDRVAQELTARGLEFQGNDGSPRCLTFTDPDGHWFQLVNPQDH